MPFIPPATAAGFEPVNVALQAARVHMNEDIPTVQAVGGQFQDNGNYFTLQSLNNGWRKLIENGSIRGYSAFTNVAIIYQFPIVASVDPASLCWLSPFGCFDGVSFHPLPKLPADFTSPLEVWERYSGQNAQFCDPPMEKMLGGIPSNLKQQCMRRWEWRTDAIWTPGSQVLEDLQIRYTRFLPDFADVGAVQWFNQTIPLMRSAHILALYLCAEVSAARKDTNGAASFTERAEEAARKMYDRDVKADQFVNTRRLPRSGRGARSNYY